MKIRLIEEIILEMPKDVRYMNEFENNDEYSLISLSTTAITYRKIMHVNVNIKEKK